MDTVRVDALGELGIVIDDQRNPELATQLNECGCLCGAQRLIPPLVAVLQQSHSGGKRATGGGKQKLGVSQVGCNQVDTAQRGGHRQIRIGCSRRAWKNTSRSPDTMEASDDQRVT
jgi:hypothetical protein